MSPSSVRFPAAFDEGDIAMTLPQLGYSRSWPHARQILPTRSSHPAGSDPLPTRPAVGPPRLVAWVAAARREVLSFGEPITDGRRVDPPRFSDSTRGDGLVLDAHSDRGHGEPQPS